MVPSPYKAHIEHRGWLSWHVRIGSPCKTEVVFHAVSQRSAERRAARAIRRLQERDTSNGGYEYVPEQ